MNTAQSKTSVLLVMASRDPVLDAMREQLERLDVVVRCLGSLQEFQQLIRRRQSADVVITGVSLPDGNWCDVLTSTVRAGSTARVLVCSQEADERFWSEAIWRGVHDVLVEPFMTEYLRRVVDCRPAREQEDRTGQKSRHSSPKEGDRRHGSEANPAAIPFPAVA